MTDIRNEWDGNPVPPSLWGRDHLSTLIYVETCAVDRQRVDIRRMRLDGDTYATSLRDNVKLYGHNDEDCLRDAFHAKLLQNKELFGPMEFTELGWEFVHSVRKSRGMGAQYAQLDAGALYAIAQRKIETA